jgi:hypothetical protein
MTPLSGNLLTDGSSKTDRDFHAGTQPKQPLPLKWLWQEGRGPVIAWFSGIAVGALWIYSGMPMICH